MDFIEECPCLVHKLSVILTAFDYKPIICNCVRTVQKMRYALVSFDL